MKFPDIGIHLSLAGRRQSGIKVKGTRFGRLSSHSATRSHTKWNAVTSAFKKDRLVSLAALRHDQAILRISCTVTALLCFANCMAYAVWVPNPIRQLTRRALLPTKTEFGIHPTSVTRSRYNTLRVEEFGIHQSGVEVQHAAGD